MTIHTLQDAFTSWDAFHFIRHSPRQRVPDAPPAKIERAHWIMIMSAFFGCDAVVVEERFRHPSSPSFVWLPPMSTIAQRRSPSSGSCLNIHQYFCTWFFMFLLSLIDACCLVLVKASLRACVAGCCHLLWHFFCVCSYACCLSPCLRHFLA